MLHLCTFGVPPPYPPPSSIMPSNRTSKRIEVHTPSLEAFEEIYPMFGAFTWFVNEALRAFVEHHEYLPADNVARAVEITLSDHEE